MRQFEDLTIGLQVQKSFYHILTIAGLIRKITYKYHTNTDEKGNISNIYVTIKIPYPAFLSDLGWYLVDSDDLDSVWNPPIEAALEDVRKKYVIGKQQYFIFAFDKDATYMELDLCYDYIGEANINIYECYECGMECDYSKPYTLNNNKMCQSCYYANASILRLKFSLTTAKHKLKGLESIKSETQYIPVAVEAIKRMTEYYRNKINFLEVELRMRENDVPT